ncbi:MAG: hypothetical protein KJ000_31450 [Pirellulaceae bacterium]|nr:hypothetical protein [Pirellulaceae bacterium]
MRVLLIGEGSHDIGPPTFDPQPRPAAGVVSTLARRVSPAISKDSLALAWTEISNLDPKKRKRGLDAKVETAIVLSAMKYGLDGTVCVADQDRDATRLSTMEEGQSRGLNLVRQPHAAACGVAVESIEAWTLGAPEAIALVLGTDAAVVQSHYRLRDVESFYQHSGKSDHRPKDILGRIAAAKHWKDSSEFRSAVAEHTDVAALKQTCPRGFRPFAEKLSAAFGPR